MSEPLQWLFAVFLALAIAWMLVLPITVSDRHVDDVKLRNGRHVTCVTTGGVVRGISCDWRHAR